MQPTAPAVQEESDLSARRSGAAMTPLAFTAALACNCAPDLSSATFVDPSTATLLNLKTTSDVVLTSTTTATISFVG